MDTVCAVFDCMEATHKCAARAHAREQVACVIQLYNNRACRHRHTYTNQHDVRDVRLYEGYATVCMVMRTHTNIFALI